MPKHPALRPQEYRNALLPLGAEFSVPRSVRLEARCAYYLLEGHAALTTVTTEKQRLSLIYFRPGELLNFIPAANQAHTMPDMFRLGLHGDEVLEIWTKTSCRFLRIEPDAFVEHLDEEPLRSLLVRALIGNLQKLLIRSVNISASPAPARLCRMIASVAEAEPPRTVPRFFTHAELAGHLSLHVMTVTKILHALRLQGILVKRNGVMEVQAPERLLSIAYQKKNLAY